MGIALDFTGTYKNRALFGIDNFSPVEFSDIEGTTGYCSEEAAGLIKERIKNLPADEPRYLDDGNHHYLSYFFLENIKEPFELLVFDHHTDMQRPGLAPLLSCGSWVLESIGNLPFLEHVYLCGPSGNDIPPEFDGKITVVPERQLKEGTALFLKNDSALPVYISVDLDILSEKEIKTIWDQGSLTYAELSACIEDAASGRRVLGIDYCG